MGISAPASPLMAVPAELAGMIPLLKRFQVDVFLEMMQKQIQSNGKRGVFTWKDMLCFQKDPIPTSLLKINSDLVGRATKLFQIILKYMGVVDSSSDRAATIEASLHERIELVGKLYKHTLKRVELRDELFAQISKQTRNSPHKQYLIRAWELMYLCASSMPPSKDIVGYLSEYVHDVAYDASTEADVQFLALNTLNALKRSVKTGPRHTIPGREEIEALLTGRRLTTIVFFLDGTFEEITYDMATTVSDSVKELAGRIKLSAYSSFGLFSLLECRNVVTGSKSPDPGNEEYIRLDGNKYIGDLLAEFKAAKERSKGGILHCKLREILECKLIFRKKLFRESDEAVTDLMFLQLSYVQLQRDYVQWNYPVMIDDAAEMSALQILVEIGYVGSPESRTDWTTLLEQFVPRQVAIDRGKCELELDILSCYRKMENLTKDDGRVVFMWILRTLPYGNSVFFRIRKIDDPTGVLPGRIIIAINKIGVHFFRQVPMEYLHSFLLRDITDFGSSNTVGFFKMRIGGIIKIFRFGTKQGEEICVALQTHINDRRSKARSEKKGKVTNHAKPPTANVEIYEKRIQDLSKSIEEFQRSTDRLVQELRAKQEQELRLRDELEGLRDSLTSRKAEK